VDPATLADEVEQGPVVVSFIAPPSLKRYTGGLYEPEPSDDLTGEVTHAALLVGAGTTDDGEQYWVVQNSWGTDWGERGRFRVLAATARAMLLETLAVAADVVADDQPGVLAAVMDPSPSFLQEAHQCTDGDVEVVIDGGRRSLRFAGSEGTETAVNCVEPCEVSGSCSSSEGCPCALQGLPFAGMNALVEKASLLCEAGGGLHLLLIGLGGGGIPTMIKQRCPTAHVESIEISATVARVASQFFGFIPSADNTVEVGDGAAAVARRVEGGGVGTYDMIMVDCFSQGDSVPEGCRSAALLNDAKRLLRPDGVVVQNIWARSAADKEKKLSGEFAAVRSLYASTFPQVREEIVAENDANQELLLAGVQGQRWADLFD
jgi:SAM-dependent methyltransferase